MFMAREDIVQAASNSDALHWASRDAEATKRTLCSAQTRHLSSPPSLLSISSPFLPKRETPAG